MRQDYKKLFGSIKIPRPPQGLFEKIMRRIDREIRLASLKRRLIFFSVLLAVSVAGFVPIFKMALDDFSSSGFMQFFRLVFSDTETVLVYWQNFVFALMESMPVMSAILVLAVIFIFLQSLKFLVCDIVIFFNLKPYGSR